MNTYHQSGQFGIGHMEGGEIKGNAKVAAIINETGEQPSKTEVIALLAELSKLVREAKIPEDAKNDALMCLGVAKKTAEKEEPNKETILETVEDAAKTLQGMSKTVDAGKVLWDKALPILIQIASWLGAVVAGSNLPTLLG